MDWPTISTKKQLQENDFLIISLKYQNSSIIFSIFKSSNKEITFKTIATNDDILMPMNLNKVLS